MDLFQTFMKKAYVFPGQGSQFPGMAHDLYESSPKAKEMLEEANEILGFRITDIMFDGTPEDLKATKVTQPAVFLHSAVLASCYEGFKPDMVAGHSLGEFSALAACGAMKFEDALRLVEIRATQMQKCCRPPRACRPSYQCSSLHQKALSPRRRRRRYNRRRANRLCLPSVPDSTH